jgi:hypothetical protein
MAPGSTRGKPFEFKWPEPPPGGSPVAELPSAAQQTAKQIGTPAPAPTGRNKKAAYNFTWGTPAAASSPPPIGGRIPNAGTLTPPTEKRGRGRPRKNLPAPVQEASVAQAAPSAPVEIFSDKQNPPEKRGRGRPKKIAQESPQSLPNGSSSDDRGGTSPDISGKRGPGRPKKAPSAQGQASAKASIDSQLQAASAAVEEKRPRGRPKKVATVGQPDLPHTAASKIANSPPEAISSPGKLTTAPAMEAFIPPSVQVELPLSAVPPEVQEDKATPSGRPLDAASVFANFGAPSDGQTEELPETLADDEELIAIEQKLRAMFNHEAPQSLVRPTHEKKSFLVPANARRENIEVTKRGTYGTQKRLVAVERVGTTIDTGTRQEEMQKIAAHPLFPECVKLIVLDQRLKDADAQGALKLRWRMERLRRLLSEVDLRVRNTLDLVNERSRALA